MSATINHETFVKYFNGAPLLTIPGITHPVTDMSVTVSRFVHDLPSDLCYSDTWKM